MKKLFIVAITAAMVISMSASVSNPDYIVTENGVTYFKSVRYGFKKCMIAKTYEGKKIKFLLEDIKSFKKAGEVYIKNSLTINGKPCDDCAFMKLIRTRHGFSLYSLKCTNKKGEYYQKCMVYKGSEFVLEVNDKNKAQMISFFTKKYN